MAPQQTDPPDASCLQPFLQIRQPDDVAKNPPILAFQRKREVEIPWGDIADGNDADARGNAAIAAVRDYFEKSWDMDIRKENCWPLLDSKVDPWPIKQIPKTAPNIEPPFFRGQFDAKVPPDPLSGFVIRHGSSGRLYHLVEASGKTLTPEDFQSFEKYCDAWQKVDGIELVFEKKEDAASFGYTSFEEIDLRPPIIQRRYEELKILRDFALKVKDKVEKATDGMVDALIKTGSAQELEPLQDRVLRLEINASDVQRQIDRLVSDAGRLGFLLCLEDKPADSKTKTRELKAGRLYTTYRRTACWTETAHRHWWQRPTKRRMEQIVEDFQEVDTRKDLVAETRTAKIKEGLHVYIFEQTPSGFATADGIKLREVMERCDYDEAFRRACVVMLPVYEESLTGVRLLSKYAIFTRPMPGIAPTILPRLSVVESLSYRTAWVETQLGELVSSINLAPGEERKVTVSSRVERETTVTRTSTSIFDIARVETSDLATEMENQARQERESSSNLQFGSKVSGGYAGITAEASASGGTTSSLKDMSQAINRVAKKASQSISQQTRQEISSTATARATTSTADEAVATIRNINQGRSLNLMFYRLYNKYRGGLFLDDLRFEVIPSVEVIAGSGVHESRSYSRKDLPHVIGEFSRDRLPFAVRNDYIDRLLTAIAALLTNEYADTGFLAQAEAGKPHTVSAGEGAATSSVGLLKVFQPAMRTLTDLGECLQLATIRTEEAMVPQDLLLAAPGLYLDAVVGTQPSTEPYSEAMRAQEVSMRQAEVFVKLSEGIYKQAMAARLTQLPAGKDANVLTGVLPDPTHTSLMLSMRIPLLRGDWALCVDDEIKNTVKPQNLASEIIVFSWDAPQEWLHAPDLVFRIRLQNEATGERIVYPGSFRLVDPLKMALPSATT